MSPTASPAFAEVEGNCTATFKNTDVSKVDSSKTSQAVDVADNEVVVVAMTSAVGFASHSIDLEIAGVSRSVSSQTDGGDTQWSDTINVKDYAWMGAGLYKVTGSATLTDGSTCSGAALINVDRFPLTTVAGGAAAAATTIGLLAVVAGTVASARDSSTASAKVENWVGNELEKAAGSSAAPPPKEEWTIFDEIAEFFGMCGGPCLMMALPGLLLTVGAMSTPSSGPPTAAGGIRLRRAPLLPRLGLGSVIGGPLAGLGAAVLLQQFAVQPLTLVTLIVYVVAGLMIGIILPSIPKVWGVGRVNAALGRAEQRLNAAYAGKTPPPPSMPPEPQP
jgi:hypothetical protein